jgi:hypothetical protein
MAQGAYVLEKALGHQDNAITEQDVSNPGLDRAKYADPSGEMMKALCWEGKNNVKVCQLHRSHSVFSQCLRSRDSC